jgi:hypothetical protein
LPRAAGAGTTDGEGGLTCVHHHLPLILAAPLIVALLVLLVANAVLVVQLFRGKCQYLNTKGAVMAESKEDVRAREASTVGVDVNEEQVRTHPGVVAANEQPHPNPHIAGQTPAVETNQPTAGPTDELQRKLGDAERSLSAHLVYENGVPSTRPEHLDPIVEALEDAVKALKSAKSKS